MKLDEITNKQDEYYTPPYAVKPILKYITGWPATVWCPFDTDESHFVKMIREEGHTVINTHLSSGHDFFTYEPSQNYDYVISNPPYSLKGQVFERLFHLGKPFAMLVGVVGLFESKNRFCMFRDNVFEIMYMDKRIAFFKNYKEQKPSLNPPFSSVYITSKMLPKQIIFEGIEK